jgi:pimeloyl-ACP methyl ester carboxylesterase
VTLGDFAGTFPYESQFLEAGRTRMHYVDEGARDAAPVLMLHGNPTWSYMYRVPIRMLADAGHRCVALDHMGFGASAKPAKPAEYTLERHVENTVAAIEALDLREITLVAHDWGGPIGLGAVLRLRDRFRALVLMNTWAWELPSFVPPFLREFRTDGLGEILALGGNLFVESIPGGMTRREPDPVMMDAYRAPFPDYWSRVGTLAFPRDIPLTERDRSAGLMGRIHESLAGLALPTLVVWGMRDRVFRPVFLDQWRELLPDARIVELPDAAHYLVEDQPEPIAREIADFLAALPAP